MPFSFFYACYSLVFGRWCSGVGAFGVGIWVADDHRAIIVKISPPKLVSWAMSIVKTDMVGNCVRLISMMYLLRLIL